MLCVKTSINSIRKLVFWLKFLILSLERFLNVCFLLVNEADGVFTLVAETTSGQVDVVIPMFEDNPVFFRLMLFQCLRITLFFSG